MTNTQYDSHFDSKTSAVTAFTTGGTTAEAQAYVTSVFEAMLDRAPSAAALALYTSAVEAGTFNKTSFTEHALTDDITTDKFNYLSSTESANAQVKQAAAVVIANAAFPSGDGVAVDPTNPTDGTTPSTDDKEIVTLSVTQDNVTTGNNDDLIYGDAGQNQNGAIANSFSTGDKIDGGAGRDTLVTSIIGDTIIEGASEDMDITARVSNVEVTKFEVLDHAVTVDAGKMDSVEEFWTDNSDATLTIDDVRLGSKLAITKDFTFGMKDVDFNAGLTVEIDSASLVNSGVSSANSQVEIKLIDATALTVEAPVGNVSVTVGFTVGGTAYILENIVSTDGTYEGLSTAIATELAVQGLTDLSVTLGNSFTDLTTGNNTTKTLAGVTAASIIITDGSGDPFTNVTFTQAAVEAVPTGFTVAGVAVPVDPAVSTALIETNLILDNAGRNSTAGSVDIGGMSNSDRGIEKFYVMVDRDSAITALNDADLDVLQQIEITSLANNGSLEIGTLDAGIKKIEADAFNGSALMLGTTSEVTGTAVTNLVELDASISGNVTFVGATTHADAQDTDTAYNYTTGSGNDTITFMLDGDTVDAEAESFTIDAASGNNTVNVTMDAGVSQNTMNALNNLTITTTSGEDTVNLDAYGKFDISTGDASDYVRINSLDANGNGTSGTWTVGQTSGAQNFASKVLYQADLTISLAGIEKTVSIETSQSSNFVATQLDINTAIKKAIAESPELAKLLTATDVTGTEQLKIMSTFAGLNDLAIDIYQPELVVDNASTGEVNLASADVAAMRQGIIATTTTYDSADLEGATEIVGELNSGTFNGVAGNFFFGSISNTSTGNGDNNYRTNLSDTDHGVDASAYAYKGFDAGTSTDSTDGINFSTINVGTGTNDLVVFHSTDASSNVLEITETFGNVTVMNFHDISANDAAQEHNNISNHAIDFTSYLTNRVDTSDKGTGTDNNDSATAIPVTLHDDDNVFTNGTAADSKIATANSINVLHYDETQADSISFADFSASQLKGALDVSSANTNLGGITHTSLDITNTTDLVGTTQNHIVMIENNENLGEYKVFSATSSTSRTVDDFSTVSELGTLDFGYSINFQTVGSTEYTALIQTLINDADNVVNVPTEAPTDAPTDAPDDAPIAVTGDVTATDAAEAFTIDTSAALTAIIAGFDPVNDTVTFSDKVAGDINVDTLAAYDGSMSLSVTAADDTDVIITINGMTAAQEFDIQSNVSSIIA